VYKYIYYIHGHRIHTFNRIRKSQKCSEMFERELFTAKFCLCGWPFRTSMFWKII